MAYDVQLEQAAVRALAALPRRDRERIVRKIEALADDPRPPGCKARAGSPGLYRLRSGDYRAISRVRDTELIVLVLKVGNRREVYRGR
jgi:mRNA interferase RelE/StbE